MLLLCFRFGMPSTGSGKLSTAGAGVSRQTFFQKYFSGLQKKSASNFDT